MSWLVSDLLEKNISNLQNGLYKDAVLIQDPILWDEMLIQAVRTQLILYYIVSTISTKAMHACMWLDLHYSRITVSS
jgi:hypothetical protein